MELLPKITALCFGTADMAANILPAIRPEVLEITAFIDERPSMRGKSYAGRQIIDFPQILDFSFDYILIACRPAERISARLRRLGIPLEKIVDLDLEELLLAQKTTSKKILRSTCLAYLQAFPGLARAIDVQALLASFWLASAIEEEKFLYQTNLVQKADSNKKIMLLMLKDHAMQDGIFSFSYRDEEIKFYLPNVPYDMIGNIILHTSTFYERELLEKIRSHIHTDSVVVDIGANIGNHTVYFSKICKCRHVFSFEPQVSVYHELKHNIRINAISNCTSYNMALGSAAGNADIIHQRPTNKAGTRFAPAADGQYRVRALDELGIEKIDFMKIDVEGMEFQVLQGAKQTVMANKPLIWVELFKENFAATHELLLGWGYSPPLPLDRQDYLFSYAGDR
jgi:FkbM family methyltransferase